MKTGSPLVSALRTLSVFTIFLMAAGGVRAQVRQAPRKAPPPPAPPVAQPVNFGALPTHDLGVPAFSDRDVAKLQATLDAKLAEPVPAERWHDTARLTLWDFARRLQLGRLSDAQESRVLAHLDAIGQAHDADVVAPARRMVSTLTIGKVAPDIEGKDLDGVDFHLSDYRGKVVVLLFTGDWCGICRTEYPYERLMVELYKNWPFAILGVNSDPDLTQAKQAKVDRDLPYRAWWDGNQEDNTGGPIATAWNVTGWPSIYVIDGQGVIRFVDLHDEDLLKAVRQLLTEQNLRSSKADASKK
jgi:peroxiredoxin